MGVRYNGPTFYEKQISLHNPFKCVGGVGEFSPNVTCDH